MSRGQLVDVRTSRRERECQGHAQGTAALDCHVTIERGEAYVRERRRPDGLVPWFRSRDLCAPCGAHVALAAGRRLPR